MQADLLLVIEKLMAAKNVQTLCAAPPWQGLENFDCGLRKTLDPQFNWPDFGALLLKNIPERTLVFGEGTFELHYAFCRLPDKRDTLLCVGPWRSGPRSEKSLQWAQKHLGAAANRAIDEFYNALPVLADAAIVPELSAMAGLLFADQGGCEAVSWHEFLPLNFRPDLRFFSEPPFERELPAAAIEQRYASENRMLDAVTLGDVNSAMEAYAQFGAFGRFKLAERDRNPMRDRKNLAIILNTLLRKAIERATVHPYYIDSISRKYALRIEGIATDEEMNALTADMVREYCTYVQRYSLRDHSPLVQKVINYINLNMDSQLSLKSLAAMCYISPSYLSNLFKQETGQTLTDYINTQRIRRAAHRLCTGNDGIAAVAEQVGILDVNYFTKIFKKVMGVTPTQYRRQHRER